MKNTTAKKLRDNLKCQKKCQSLAVVHINVLRLINGSESDKQGKKILGQSLGECHNSAALCTIIRLRLKLKNVLRENTESNL